MLRVFIDSSVYPGDSKKYTHWNPVFIQCLSSVYPVFILLIGAMEYHTTPAGAPPQF